MHWGMCVRVYKCSAKSNVTADYVASWLPTSRSSILISFPVSSLALSLSCCFLSANVDAVHQPPPPHSGWLQSQSTQSAVYFEQLFTFRSVPALSLSLSLLLLLLATFGYCVFLMQTTILWFVYAIFVNQGDYVANSIIIEYIPAAINLWVHFKLY